MKQQDDLGENYRCSPTPHVEFTTLNPITSSNESVLDEAKRLVDGKRQQDYGSPTENHGRTAAMWSAYLGVNISPRQVCMLNALQKISRDAHAPTRDNLVDLAGYARNADILQQSADARDEESARMVRRMMEPNPLIAELFKKGAPE